MILTPAPFQYNILLQTFDGTEEIDAKNSIASSILHKALNLATQTVVNLDIGALLIIQVNKLSSSHLNVQPQDSTLCFSTVNEHVIQPGQSLSLHLDALTNYPPAPSNMVYHLHDDLPVYFNFSLLYILKFHFIKVINVSDKAITLPPDTQIVTAYFPCQHLYLHKV